MALFSLVGLVSMKTISGKFIGTVLSCILFNIVYTSFHIFWSLLHFIKAWVISSVPLQNGHLVFMFFIFHFARNSMCCLPHYLYFCVGIWGIPYVLPCFFKIDFSFIYSVPSFFCFWCLYSSYVIVDVLAGYFLLVPNSKRRFILFCDFFHFLIPFWYIVRVCSRFIVVS